MFHLSLTLNSNGYIFESLKAFCQMNATLQDLQWCSNCVSMSTRPRITFDHRGCCNACVWAEKKETLDWSSRKAELEKLLKSHRRTDGNFDCLIPVSGGKDGSYVCYNLKHKYGMNPLAITIPPPLPLELGQRNLQSFKESGYDLLSVDPDYETMRILNRAGLVDLGFPYYGWMTAIHTAVVRVAVNLGINLIFYGEDGEVEYGGSSENVNSSALTIEYIKDAWLENGHQMAFSHLNDDSSDYFFKWPEEDELNKSPVFQYFWSYFEDWDPYRNFLVAKEHCGLQEAEMGNSGTFTNFAQNDQGLYALHTYLMFLKFGFGRANQDACIEIRRGAMDRQQAVQLVRLYDGLYPDEFIDQYLEYYKMTLQEFHQAIDKFANKDLFEKVDGRWQKRFTIE
jgi:N-acetyl sugar amidotransferase